MTEAEIKELIKNNLTITAKVGNACPRLHWEGEKPSAASEIAWAMDVCVTFGLSKLGPTMKL